MKIKVLLPAAACLLFAACSSNPDQLPPTNPFHPEQQSARELKLEASALYKAARDSLNASDFQTAINRYNQIAVRYPFTEYAIQAQLEKVYALYRNYQQDDSLTEADRFLREHPRHPSADYVQYIKGLANFDRDSGLAGFLGMDTSKQDVSFARKSFDDFSLLVQKYPASRYAGDARSRMVFLRNRIADHEMYVVRFYMRRGAYVAAAKRAEQVVEQYPGAPATLEALQSMQTAYREMGLENQAADAEKLLAAQEAVLEPEQQPKKAWWKIF
jgi:outer membrane protein assembly factor BamD